MDDYLKKVHNRPVLIVQGQEDNVVAVYNARYMYNRLCNAEMVIVDDADHRFENKIRDRELITIKWLKKHFVNE
jgi:dipeptidyl aminopeptidase/acylaminoacyl peptidase